MYDDQPTAIANQRLLAAMKAANPPVEKLMADRLALRQEMRQAKSELEQAQRRTEDLLQLREVQLPRYIGIAKAVTLLAASLALMALALALFIGLFEIKFTTTLFASLLLPIWLVDLAERKFGRWVLHHDGRADYLQGNRVSLITDR